MEMQYLVPSYFDKFTCLGGACGCTCCQGWPIYMQKSEYKNLMKQRVSSDLKDQLNRFAVRIDGERQGHGPVYAEVHMNEEGRCPLLTEDGFCKLQIECGAQMLPSICQIFPRSRNRIVEGVDELGIRLACEATARLLTETIEPIQFDIVNECPPIDNGAYIFSKQLPDRNPLLLHYWDIKALGIGILQNRFYTLPQRILYLGFVLKHLSEYEETGRLSEVATLLQGLMEQEDSETLRQSLEQLPVDHSLSAVTQIFLLNIKQEKMHEALYQRAINAIGEFDAENDSASIKPPLYLEKREQFNAFCEKYPHVMENIAVHLFHEFSMPFGGVSFGQIIDQKLNIWDNYLFYCWRMSTLQFALGALVTPDTPLKEVALMVSTLARKCPNIQEGAETCVKKMAEVQMTTVDRLSILLKG